MIKFKSSDVKLSIDFEFSKINNKTMSVDVCYDGKTYNIHPLEPGIQTIELDVKFPNLVKIIFSGKDNSVDTIVVDDKIVDDLFVKISNICLDRIDIDQSVLCKVPQLKTSNCTINSNYIGFNGIVELELTETNVFNQIMYWKRKHL